MKAITANDNCPIKGEIEMLQAWIKLYSKLKSDSLSLCHDLDIQDQELENDISVFYDKEIADCRREIFELSNESQKFNQ